MQADAGHLERVLMNLVVNAREAMPAGGPLTIEVDNATVAARAGGHARPVPPGSYVTIAVTDTGVGMDAATRARMFEPFFTTKATGQGTGLGLASVYGIVQQSQGHITVDSERGPGHHRSRLYLPRTDAVARPRSPRRPQTRQLPRRTRPCCWSRTTRCCCQLMSEVLRQAGYQVLEAAQRRRGAARVRAAHGDIHLLLTDVVMPRVNGVDAGGRACGGSSRTSRSRSCRATPTRPSPASARRPPGTS